MPHDGFGWKFWSCAGAIAIVAAAALTAPIGWQWRVAAAWFVVFLAPSSGIVPINAPVADRFLYLPSVAGAIVVASVAHLIGLQRRRTRILAATIFGVLMVAYAAATVQGISVWKNDLTLWSHVIRHNSQSWRGLTNIGAFANNAGDFRKGLESADRALELKPEYGEAHAVRAFALDRMGQHAEAKIAYRHAIRLHTYPAEVMYVYADFLERTDQLKEAAECYERLLAQRPQFADARVAAGIVYMRLKQPEKAIGHWKEGLKHSPDNKLLRHNLERATKTATSTAAAFTTATTTK